MNQRNVNSILAIFACLLWSSAFAGIKIGLPFTTPFYFAGTRFFLSGLLILPFILKKIKSTVFTKALVQKIIVVSVLQVSLQYSLFYLGMSKVAGATGAIIIGSQPLFIAIAAHFFAENDKLTFTKALIILFGFSGIVLISIGKSGLEGNTQFMGILLMLCVNLSGAASNIIVAGNKVKVQPLVLSSLSMMLGGFTLFVIALFTEDIYFIPKELDFYISLVWLTAISTIAISLWFVLLKKPEVKVSNLNVWKFLIPVSGAILAWLILPDEHANLLSILGMLITGFALVALNVYRRKYQKL